MLKSKEDVFAASGISGFQYVTHTNQTMPFAYEISIEFFNGYQQFNFTTYKCLKRGSINIQCFRFAQMMWIQTKRFGCAFTPKMPNDTKLYLTSVLCVYDPPGNIPGGYLDNIPLMMVFGDKPVRLLSFISSFLWKKIYTNFTKSISKIFFNATKSLTKTATNRIKKLLCNKIIYCKTTTKLIQICINCFYKKIVPN